MITTMPDTRERDRVSYAEPAPLIADGFADRLKKARKHASFTSQPKLAAAMRINPNTIWRHESGYTLPSLDLLHAYARALRVSVEYLQHGSQVPHAVGLFLASDEANMLLGETRNTLPELQWRKLVPGHVEVEDVAIVARLIDRKLRTNGDSVNETPRRRARANHDLFDDSER